MPNLALYGSGRIQTTTEQGPKFKYTPTIEEMSTNPQVVSRKMLSQLMQQLNTIENYRNYGVIMDVIETTSPRTNINKLLASTTSATNNIFIEYLVLPIDLAHASIATKFQTKSDILKSTTMVRCSSKIKDKLPTGTIVEFEYANSTKEEASISAKYDDYPPIIIEDNSKEKKTAKDTFTEPPCSDNSNIKPNSDSINSSQESINQDEAPVPNFSTSVCTAPEERLSLYNPPSSDELISKYFTLSQLTYSETAKQRGISNQPSPDEIERLAFLARTVLDKLVDYYGVGSFVINSVFRGQELNNAVGGAPNSQHRLGTAADLSFVNVNDTRLLDIFDEIKSKKVINQYDQLIFESSGPGSFWFHISIAHPKTPNFTRNRLEVLSYGHWNSDSSGKKTYASYNRNGIELYRQLSGVQFTRLA